MSGHVDPLWRERIALRYLDAHDAGDLDTIAGLWDKATRDAELAELLGELEEGLDAEDDDAGVAATDAACQADAARVVELARTHIPTAFPPEPAGLPPPLTSADVALRVSADLQLARRSTQADRDANEQLIRLAQPLPAELAQPAFDRWAAATGVTAGAVYWRAFRQAAVLMTIARCQQSGKIAAARDVKPRGPSGPGNANHE